MDLKKERIDAFKLGYLQAVADYSNFLASLPARHGSEILFNKDVYAKECNAHNENAINRAELRAEAMITELMEMEEKERKESK